MAMMRTPEPFEWRVCVEAEAWWAPSRAVLR